MNLQRAGQLLQILPMSGRAGFSIYMEARMFSRFKPRQRVENIDSRLLRGHLG